MDVTAATPLSWLPQGWAEPCTLVLMLGCFAAATVWRHWPIGVGLALAAWIGAAANGSFLPIRHLVEGSFAYLDPILVIATAMILMRVLADGGALGSIETAVESAFGSRPLLLLPTLMLIVMVPGMITGSSTASVLTTGAMVAAALITAGVAPERAAAFVAMGGVLGMIAPPVNIPAMIIGGGLDLPYAGFGVPLSLLAFPVALVLAYYLAHQALQHRRDTGPRPRPEAANGLPLWRALLAPGVAVVLMVLPRLWPRSIPDPGLPLVFVVTALVAVATSRRFPLGRTLLRATEESLPVLAILVGVGAFIQVMTLTGARGFLVSLMVGAPPWALFAAAGLGLPLFGAVSAFGSASVLGVPFLLALLGRNEIATTAALSALAALGDLMLPAALAPTLAAQVTGVADRMRVLRWCLLPALLVVVAAVLLLVLAPALGRWPY